MGKNLSEYDICLVDATFAKDRIIVRGRIVTPGRATRLDYSLNFRPNISLALIEANTVHDSEGHAHATTPDLPQHFPRTATALWQPILFAAGASLALNSAKNRLRVLLVDGPPQRRTHISQRSQVLGPPLSEQPHC
jgi:hypothetical protein